MKRQIRNLLFSLIALTSFLSAKNNTCSLDTTILATIGKAERSSSKASGYPYLISFNNKKQAKQVRKELGDKIFMNNRTIDCFSQKLCTDITLYLVKKGIVNLDLGAFQINYKYHKMPIKSYFSFKDSYYKACNIVENLIKNYGYSWETIARYHSSTPKHNYAYLQHISNLKGIKNE